MEDAALREQLGNGGKMSQTEGGGVSYRRADAGYFEKWFSLGAEKGGSVIGGVLLDMAVFGAMFSHILQAISFILLRKNQPHINRPYRSPLGIGGAVVTIIIAVATLYYQVQDPNFFSSVFWVGVWFVVAIIYFAMVGRHKLIPSPKEELAMENRAKA